MAVKITVSNEQGEVWDTFTIANENDVVEFGNRIRVTDSTNETDFLELMIREAIEWDRKNR